MKLRDLKRTYRSAVMHPWPPSVLAQSLPPGGRLIGVGEGALKSVRRDGQRLSLTIEHEGNEAIASLECDEPPSLVDVEKALLANIGRTIKEIGDVGV